MIGSISIKLKPLTEVICEGRGEEHIYRLFINIVKKENEEIAEQFQNFNEDLPVTLSPFLKGIKYSKGKTYAYLGEYPIFRITYLKEEILEIILKSFNSCYGKKELLNFANGKVQIAKVDIQKSFYANFITFKNILSNAEEKENIVLEFSSPTIFEISEKRRLFPDPEIVFCSLLEKWNKFSSIKLSEQIKNEFGKIEVIQYRLTTEFVNFSNKKIPGFLGKVNYRLLKSMDKKIVKYLNALADFSFYSGVGSKTIIGMGQARRAN
ncbi:CRISPR system precrRNA processing endoribonuclease RAMP protein Cas6 [Candidatus Aminicenantes bacterium AC-335-B20]|jgi:CRISPR-associated endoribonuclease Cas6|nr:CRISPR system precrRNA processing endoribonuclease RAMP protein Cas6 [SCandidatus Aminicenantes bacterium Aminicenantia_JdfR_composite]MCP2596274.1 CRISPR system precrRNA processing endoribonuclease RAMP protein Cas6 [Candidatus Aminicenantes bacterium AC-335-G13]MCP2597849.1 CRISPR system precrRNA processing endoribonuclease RAMP protein Cas6 [Candidatus Aminicenantes bacterium AC-335-L06]MCP2599057.1 CRISPR system precrRNA processing endoribonuclease RAMP protein Cas6 [Candidatus Aminicenan